MRPFYPPRPNQPHRGRLGGDPGPPPLPAVPMQHPQLNHPAFPPPVPNLPAAANPMAAAAANPFLALQLLGQAQQLQNLGFLAAAALQQQQQQPPQPQPQPFFPGGFPPNPNQFAPLPGPHAGFNGGGAFRPGGAGICGPRPPRPMMSPAGKGFNDNGAGRGAGAPRSMHNVARKDWNSSGGNNGELNRSENKAGGISDLASANDVRSKTTDQQARFNSGRDGRDSRQFGASIGRGRGRHFNQGRGRGTNNWRETKPNFTSHKNPTSGRCSDSPTPASGGRRKRPLIIYDANEVKQWVEARKKNYPTSVNINKKLSQSQSDSQDKDKEAQMRRQELKEVLAKQQALGFELPELPPGYLSGTEDQGDEKKSKWKTQPRDCRFGNCNNAKRPRYDRGDVRSPGPKVWNRTPRNDVATRKSREPTLLQKLLSSDIKRDRHRLLHAFKFMALNNFFRDWPDKPLEFPSVKVNHESNIAAEDLDDLEDTEMTKDSSLGLKGNDDQKELTSIDGETGSADHNEEDEDGASGASSYEDGNEDAHEEQCNESEDDFSA